jgi:hypothetical protein
MVTVSCHEGVWLWIIESIKTGICWKRDKSNAFLGGTDLKYCCVCMHFNLCTQWLFFSKM